MIKPKILMAIVLPILLVAGGSWYYFAQPVPRLEYKEGYNSLSYNITNLSISPGIDKTVYATTLINNGDGIVNLSVKLRSYATDGHVLIIFLQPAANVVLSHRVASHAQSFVFKVRELNNATACYNFQMSFVSSHNATPWPSDKIWPGAWAPYTAYIGFTPQKEKFEMSDWLEWDLYDFQKVRVHTLQIEGIIKIYSQEIPVAIDVTIDTSQVEAIK